MGAGRNDRREVVEEGSPRRRPTLKVRFAAGLGIALLRLFGLTWRQLWVQEEILDQWRGRASIFAFWHGHSLVPAWAYRNRGVAVMVSLHRDGEIMNRALAHLGYRRIRGSSTRGGREAMAAMLEILREGGTVAVTPDGPKGPIHTVHPGVLLLAARTGAPILPAGVAASYAWRIRSWDSYMIPKPFSGICIALGEPLFVSDDLDRAGLQAASERLRETLFDLDAKAARALGKNP